MDGRSLSELQKEMVDLVYSKEDRSGEYEEKTGFYREMTRAFYSGVMEQTFEQTYAYFKKNKQLKQWDDAFEKYLTECPPKQFDFDISVPQFIPFIPGAEWVREAADYEHAMTLAWHAQEKKGLINSTLHLRVYENDVADWIEKVEEQPEKIESWLPPKSELIAVAIYRDLELNEIRTLKVQPAVLDLLSQWQAGKTPRQSAEEIAKLSNQKVGQVLKNLAPVLEMLHQEKILLEVGSA
jgi:hypothetical protein